MINQTYDSSLLEQKRSLRINISVHSLSRNLTPKTKISMSRPIIFIICKKRERFGRPPSFFRQKRKQRNFFFAKSVHKFRSHNGRKLGIHRFCVRCNDLWSLMKGLSRILQQLLNSL